jgi:hypothetical protein
VFEEAMRCVMTFLSSSPINVSEARCGRMCLQHRRALCGLHHEAASSSVAPNMGPRRQWPTWLGPRLTG